MFGDSKTPPLTKIPIPPSNLQILNNHLEIWVQNEIMQILDVWWFKNLAPLQNPNSTFKPTNFKQPLRKLGPKWNYATFRCLVIQKPRP